MKKNIALLASVAALFLVAAVTPASAAEEEKEKKDKVTITGEGKCAKCSLKEADKCQNVIEVEEGGKKVNYYLTQNKVSKEFHDNICKESKKVTATGTVKEVDGKKEFTASKIDLADKK